MVVLYAAGVYINPKFFGQTDAFSAILRDTARFGVMAAGMTFVIINKDLDLSVGSTFGLVATVFSIAFSQSYYDLGIVASLVAAVIAGLAVGLVNGFFVTVLKVPSFITTLTMLFIGRGLVLGRRAARRSPTARRRRATAPGSSRSARPTRSASTTRSLSSSW